ncbi:MAG: hypothetical protein AAB614_03255 [Patescibacteria group bacterium]
MKLVIFFLFAMMFLIFVIASVILLYHFINFRFAKNQHTLLIVSFIIISFVLSFFEFALFFSINWDEVFSFISNGINLQEDGILKSPF